MFTFDWLTSIQEKYGTSDDIHIENYQQLLDHLRATDDNTPKYLTAKLLKKLLTGTSAGEISRIMGTASRYNKILDLFNYYNDEAAKLKKMAAHPAATEEEKAELKTKWEIAWEKREAYWASIEIVGIPLTQVCFDIEGSKYFWYVDIDRIA